jgi:hypothetical protein
MSSYGVMNEQSTEVCFDIMFAILAIPRRCRSRPSRVKSWFVKKSRMVSPSSTSHPKQSAVAIAIVVFPEPESPVNQITLFSIYQAPVRIPNRVFNHLAFQHRMACQSVYLVVLHYRFVGHQKYRTYNLILQLELSVH